jgi:hypothetical protein
MEKTSTNCAELDRNGASAYACFIEGERRVLPSRKRLLGHGPIPFWVSFAPSSGMPTDAASTMTAVIVLRAAGRRLLVVARGRSLRPAGAAHVRHNEPIALAQRGYCGRKCVACLGKPMQQNHRFRSPIDVAVVKRHAIDRGRGCLDGESGRLRGLFDRELRGLDAWSAQSACPHPHRKGQFAAPFGPVALHGRPVSGSARQWAAPRRRPVDHDDGLDGTPAPAQ